MSEADDIVLAASGVTRTFAQGGSRLEVINDASFVIRRGEMVALVGPSGSGKSTLLHIVGLLERPSAGSIELTGRPVAGLADAARTALRRSALGFVYQYHHLLPEFSALENVAMPLSIRRMPETQAHERARAMLAEVGLSHRVEHRPGELSGGERQRCAFARAMVTAPACVLADEPTGNLDAQTADEVFEAMVRLSDSHGTAFVLVTHDAGLAARMGRVLELAEGKLRPR